MTRTSQLGTIISWPQESSVTWLASIEWLIWLWSLHSAKQSSAQSTKRLRAVATSSSKALETLTWGPTRQTTRSNKMNATVSISYTQSSQERLFSGLNNQLRQRRSSASGTQLVRAQKTKRCTQGCSRRADQLTSSTRISRSKPYKREIQ